MYLWVAKSLLRAPLISEEDVCMCKKLLCFLHKRPRWTLQRLKWQHVFSPELLLTWNIAQVKGGREGGRERGLVRASTSTYISTSPFCLLPLGDYIGELTIVPLRQDKACSTVQTARLGKIVKTRDECQRQKWIGSLPTFVKPARYAQTHRCVTEKKGGPCEGRSRKKLERLCMKRPIPWEVARLTPQSIEKTPL